MAIRLQRSGYTAVAPVVPYYGTIQLCGSSKALSKINAILQLNASQESHGIQKFISVENKQPDKRLLARRTALALDIFLGTQH